MVEFLNRSFMQFAFILRFNMYKNLIDKSISIVLWDKFYKIMGDCIMPREGIFTRVLHGGVLTEGDEIVIEKAAGEADGQ